MSVQRLHYTRRTMYVLVALCLLPLATLIVSALVAALFGCELNEAGPQPCNVLGFDIGGVLSTFFVGGWMSLITIPLLVAILFAWGLFEGGSIWRRRRQEKKAASRGETEA